MDRRFAQRLTLGMAATALVAGAALANEVMTYSYDARGRLVKVARTGTVNNNVMVNMTFDKADNRTNRTVSGAP